MRNKEYICHGYTCTFLKIGSMKNVKIMVFLEWNYNKRIHYCIGYLTWAVHIPKMPFFADFTIDLCYVPLVCALWKCTYAEIATDF